MLTPIPPHPRSILADPAEFHHCPALLQSAWATLKAARGQSVDFDRIGPPRHITTCPGAATALADHRAARAPRNQITARAAILSGLPGDGGAA